MSRVGTSRTLIGKRTAHAVGVSACGFGVSLAVHVVYPAGGYGPYLLAVNPSTRSSAQRHDAATVCQDSGGTSRKHCTSGRHCTLHVIERGCR